MTDSVSAGRSDVSEELESAPLVGWPPRARLDYLAAGFELLALLAFIGVILITLLQVFARYILHVSLPWTEEVARILFVGSMMVGIAIATRHHENIVVDFLFVRLSRRGKALTAFAFNCAILVFVAIWLRGSVQLFAVNAESTFVTVPWLRVSHLYGLEAICILLIAVFIVADMVQQIRVLRSTEKS